MHRPSASTTELLSLSFLTLSIRFYVPFFFSLCVCVRDQHHPSLKMIAPLVAVSLVVFLFVMYRYDRRAICTSRLGRHLLLLWTSSQRSLYLAKQDSNPVTATLHASHAIATARAIKAVVTESEFQDLYPNCECSVTELIRRAQEVLWDRCQRLKDATVPSQDVLGSI